MTYDAARAEVTLFGGAEHNDTWTWDGSDWTERQALEAPRARSYMGLAYDATRAEVVLFGGDFGDGRLADTWTWDGTAWTQRFPDHAPVPRVFVGMATEGAGDSLLLFGGTNFTNNYSDTWAWDGADWSIPLRGSIQLRPASGPPGTTVKIEGSGYAAHDKIVVIFHGADGRDRKLAKAITDNTGAFEGVFRGPPDTSPGRHRIEAVGRGSGQTAKRFFRVT
jgi:hypothetical protein